MGHHWDRAGGDTVSGVIGLVQGGDTMVALLGWVRGDDTVVVSPRRIGGELCGLVEMRLGLLLWCHCRERDTGGITGTGLVAVTVVSLGGWHRSDAGDTAGMGHVTTGTRLGTPLWCHCKVEQECDTGSTAGML